MSTTFADNITWFRQSATYINAHRDKTFVLMFDGDALLDANFDNLIQDIALLSSLGVKLVLVHGARPQIDLALHKLNVHSQFHQGLRITDDAALLAVKAAIGTVKSDIEARLSMRLPNSSLHGANFRLISGNFVTAKPLGVIDGVDFQHTGEVRSIDANAIKDCLDMHNMVLLSCCGYSPSGEMFNLAVEDVAQCAASALGADKFILFCQEQGLCTPNSPITYQEITTNELQACLPTLPEPQRQLATSALQAVKAGVNRAHIISYALEQALLQELFTRQGSGTLLTQQPYELFRAAKIDDVADIAALLQPLQDAGLLITRTQARLEDDIKQFYVLERDGMLTACAALYAYEPVAELACFAVHKDYQGAKRGQTLLENMQKTALNEGFSQLFVLTTRTSDWFIEQGFCPSSVAALPEDKKHHYNPSRNSKILFKHLV